MSLRSDADGDVAEIHRIYSDPAFRRLAQRRGRLGWSFTAVAVSVYVAFFVVIALDPDPFGDRVAGFASVGILVVVALFVVAFVMTGVYLRLTTRSLVPQQRQVTDELGLTASRSGGRSR